MGKTIRNHPLATFDKHKLLPEYADAHTWSTDKCGRKNDKLDFKTANGRQLHDDSHWGVQGKRDMKKSGRRAERRNINFEE